MITREIPSGDLQVLGASGGAIRVQTTNKSSNRSIDDWVIC